MAEKLSTTSNSNLWISYQWACNEERDFSYIAGQLTNENFNAVYDSFRTMPNARLSTRIVQRLQSIGFDGWLYVLTHQCITRRDFTEELTDAIDQAKLHMGPGFPMAGLMYGIATTHLPVMLRMLPCISLGDPSWNSQVHKVFGKKISGDPQSKRTKESRFIWKIHSHFDGDKSLTAIEVRTRGESIQNWRFAVPVSCSMMRWGHGIADTGDISRICFGKAKGSGRFEKTDVFWFGAYDTVSISESAYAVFKGKLPDFVCFGPSNSRNGTPGRMEIFWPHRFRN